MNRTFSKRVVLAFLILLALCMTGAQICHFGSSSAKPAASTTPSSSVAPAADRLLNETNSASSDSPTVTEASQSQAERMPNSKDASATALNSNPMLSKAAAGKGIKEQGAAEKAKDSSGDDQAPCHCGKVGDEQYSTTGTPVHVEGEFKLLMVNLKAPGFSWGSKPGDVVD